MIKDNALNFSFFFNVFIILHFSLLPHAVQFRTTVPLTRTVFSDDTDGNGYFPRRHGIHAPGGGGVHTRVPTSYYRGRASCRRLWHASRRQCCTARAVGRLLARRNRPRLRLRALRKAGIHYVNCVPDPVGGTSAEKAARRSDNVRPRGTGSRGRLVGAA